RGARAGPLEWAEEQGGGATVADMYIEGGAPTAADVTALGIRVGDPVTFSGELAEFSDGHRVCGKGMDDRAGVAILIQVLAELKGAEPFGTVHAVGTVLEQVGLRGAAMAAHRLRPDYAIAIDGAPPAHPPHPDPTPP